ncbi:atp-binding cassette sub-family f member 3 [Anaeramoeba ignava]|uniref:Atp-binding cassette sub-family f member 3 n=1 Tax=Anaeramoeba ignava TaxID=1746090 RepID=A0A9Q0R6H0_ANAIG|nr:atp-binding cassette sub-family f member 3 [Anaeramoeba ignava]
MNKEKKLKKKSQVKEIVNEVIRMFNNIKIDESAINFTVETFLDREISQNQEELFESIIPYITDYFIGDEEDDLNSNDDKDIEDVLLNIDNLSLVNNLDFNKKIQSWSSTKKSKLLVLMISKQMDDIGVFTKQSKKEEEKSKKLAKPISIIEIIQREQEEQENMKKFNIDLVKRGQFYVLKYRERFSMSREDREKQKSKLEEKKLKKELKEIELNKKRVAEFEVDEKTSQPLIPIKVHSTESTKRSGDFSIRVSDISIAFGGLSLLAEAELSIFPGRRYGLVGRNGIGKTTLLRKIAKREFKIPKQVTISLVEQEVVGDDRTALEHVLSSDIEREELLKEAQYIEELLEQNENKDNTDNNESDESIVHLNKKEVDFHQKRLIKVYQRLGEIDADSAQAQAGSILKGLGFEQDMQLKTTKELSGGWRMRVSLAQAIFSNPDVLLLDEPDNFLDLPGMIWLEDYLVNKWENSLVVVSHSRGFINSISTDIIHFYNKKLHYYKGNYDSFEKTRTEQMINQNRKFEKNKIQRKHIQSYIDRFRVRASTAKMAQSRIKLLNKIGTVNPVIGDKSIKFSFVYEIEPITPPVIQCLNITFGYFTKEELMDGELNQNSNENSNENPNQNSIENSNGNLIQKLSKEFQLTKEQKERVLLENVDLNIDLSSRIAIVGPNGLGKSTLLKLIDGTLEPISGSIFRNPKVKVFRFAQHFVDQMDMKQTPVEYLHEMFPSTPLIDLRKKLGSFGLSGDVVFQKIRTLSGGQKSRVLLASILLHKPQILLLDEPSSYLSIEAVDALIHALNQFEGGIILVTHDERLISHVCDSIFIIQNKRCEFFDGDFEDYKDTFRRKF